MVKMTKTDQWIATITGLLAGITLLASYFFYHLPLTNKVAELRHFAETEESEIQRLEKTEAALKEIRKKKEQPPKAPTQLNAEFMASISALLEKNVIQVNQITPSTSGNRPALSLSFATDYITLLHLLSNLESIGVVMERMTIAAAKNEKEKKVLPVEMRLVAPLVPMEINAEEMDKERTKSTAKIGVNPFDRERRMAMLAGGEAGKSDTDLTWQYRLTSIGQLSDGTFIASINRREYRVGDWLDDKAIIKIHKDHVLLKMVTQWEELEYRIGFRKQATKLAARK